MRIRKLINIAAATLLCVSLAGCATNEDVPLVMVDSEDDVISYSLVNASYSDVVKTVRIDCSYVQTTEQEVSFPVTGKYVDKVYVHNGDKVKKGDILCELSSQALEEEIERLTYQIQRNELQLSYLDIQENLDIQDRWLPTLGNPYMNTEAISESVEAIQESYKRRRDLLNDSLEFDRADLSNKQRELRQSRIYASMDGVVYKLLPRLEGSTTKADTVIMTIVDKSQCLFKVKGTDNKEFFKEGEPVDMKVSFSSSSGDYVLVPYQMENWVEDMLFEVSEAPDNADIEVGTLGAIYIETDKRSNVLTIPADVLHIADGKAFVYVVNENNMRDIKYIDIGLVGDTLVEVTGGLTEGEKVVRK